MEKAKVYYSDLRTSPTSNLLDKMERLLKRAGIEQLPLKDSFAAIKIHFGEPGNLTYLRPNPETWHTCVPIMQLEWQPCSAAWEPNLS